MAALSEKDGDGEVPFVGKYQSAERIWKRLLEIGAAGDWEQPSSVGSRKTEIIGNLLPFPGSEGAGSGLLAAASFPERKGAWFLTHRRVFRPCRSFLAAGERGELSELYYCCCQGRLSGGQLRAAACRWGTVDWIAPPERPEDLYRNGAAL